MIPTVKGRVQVALLLAIFSACAVRVPPVRLPPGAAPERPVPPEKAWENVLSRFVDETGRIDFAGLARDRSNLDIYVEYLGRVSPESQPRSFPTPQSRLAFCINAYNALAMYGVLISGMPPDLNAVKVRFFYRSRFLLGGRSISLLALENKVIRPLGDPRVHMALNCMARGCPRLPRRPFDAAKLDAQLETGARDFFREGRNVRLEPERRTVRFNQILQFYTEDFLKVAPSLIAFANGYREAKIPADWRVEFIPYDWRLNSQ
jgi:hypothetical protein